MHFMLSKDNISFKIWFKDRILREKNGHCVLYPWRACKQLTTVSTEKFLRLKTIFKFLKKLTIRNIRQITYFLSLSLFLCLICISPNLFSQQNNKKNNNITIFKNSFLCWGVRYCCCKKWNSFFYFLFYIIIHFKISSKLATTSIRKRSIRCFYKKVSEWERDWMGEKILYDMR